MKIQSYSISLVGGRERNEDSLIRNDDAKLYVVADGVGGGARGDDASKMAVVTVERLFTEGQKNLRACFEVAQQEVLDESLRAFKEAVMGTTCTAVHLEESLVQLCHIGDSHCYWYSQGQMRLMTEDHESYDESMGATVLTSYMGIPTNIYPVKIQHEYFHVLSGDWMLLCSDGLYKQLDELRLIEYVRLMDSGEKSVDELLSLMAQEAVSNSEYSDNVTVVLLKVD